MAADEDVPLAAAGRLSSSGSSSASLSSTSGTGSSSSDDDSSDPKRRRRSPSSDISELSEPPNATAGGDGSGEQVWPSGDLDDLGDLPTLAYDDVLREELPSSNLDRVWSEEAAAAAVAAAGPLLLPAEPALAAQASGSTPTGTPPGDDAAAGAGDTQADKDDKRRRNREAAVRFRKNKKMRDSKLHAELASLRERDEGWRKREEEWKQREAALQHEKAALQTQLEQFKRLFSKQNVTSVVSASLCVCMAVVCVAMPAVHVGQGAATSRAAASPTARSLLSIDMATYRASPGVSFLPNGAAALDDPAAYAYPDAAYAAGAGVGADAWALPVLPQWLDAVRLWTSSVWFSLGKDSSSSSGGGGGRSPLLPGWIGGGAAAGG